MNLGIILAAGKGTRLQSTDRNKTTLEVGGKPLIQYGVDLFARTVDKTIIVVGAFSDSVINTVTDKHVFFAHQTEQKGTGHAAKVAIDKIIEVGLHPDHVLLGYGDHMMYYQPEMVEQILTEHQKHNAAITLVTTHHENPMELAWGRIVKNTLGYVDKIVEQKDANETELKITELNAGFYCFGFDFMSEELKHLQASPVTAEYYLTDLIEAANKRGLNVVALSLPFSQVGTGVNTPQQLEATQLDLAVAT